MTKELYWLTLTVLMTALFWVPYILDRMAVRGLMGTLSAAVPETGQPQSGWALRALQARASSHVVGGWPAPFVFCSEQTLRSNATVFIAACDVLPGLEAYLTIK